MHIYLNHLCLFSELGSRLRFWNTHAQILTVLLHPHRLLLLEGGPGSPSCLLGGKHIVSWGYEDMLPAPDSNPGSSSENKGNARALPWARGWGARREVSDHGSQCFSAAPCSCQGSSRSCTECSLFARPVQV